MAYSRPGIIPHLAAGHLSRSGMASLLISIARRPPAVPKRETMMFKLAMMGAAALVLARYADILPNSQAMMVLGGSIVTVLMIWAGLFARV
jgi:hypothetical protein